MSNDTPQETLLQELTRFFRRFKPGGDLAPIDDRDEWEKLVRSNPPEEQELVNELARFADLWRYLQERNEKLGPEIVKALDEVHAGGVASCTGAGNQSKSCWVELAMWVRTVSNNEVASPVVLLGQQLLPAN